MLHLRYPCHAPVELHVLQCFFAKGSNKKQRTCRIISSLANRDFSFLMITKCSWGNLTMWNPFLHLPKKDLPLPFILDKRRTCLDTHLKGELIDLF